MSDAIITLKNAVTENEQTLRPQNAPVTLVEYGNFECDTEGGIKLPENMGGIRGLFNRLHKKS